MSWVRVFASVVASAIGLAFWWALTEPLPVPPAILLGVAGAILFCAGLIAGNGGAIAAPVALLFLSSSAASSRRSSTRRFGQRPFRSTSSMGSSRCTFRKCWRLWRSRC